MSRRSRGGQGERSLPHTNRADVLNEEVSSPGDVNKQDLNMTEKNQCDECCLLEVYILTTSKVISGWVPTSDSVYVW